MQQHNYVGYFIIILSWAHNWPTQWPASRWLITCKSICRALHWYCRGQVFESHTSLNCFRLFFTTAKVVSRNLFNSFHPAFPIIICFSYIHYLTITSLHYCERKKIYFVSLSYLPLFRHRSTLLSTVLRKSVRFSIINIFFMIKNSFQVEIWPISHLNDSETQGRGL